LPYNSQIYGKNGKKQNFPPFYFELSSYISIFAQSIELINNLIFYDMKKNKEYKRIKGLIAATFTPMDEAGNVNLKAIEDYADLIAHSGITGVFVCGTTGESLSLTVEERKDITAKWIECAKNRFEVIVHVGSNSQKEAMELAAHAEKSGADAIGAMSPCFFKPATINDLINFFIPVAESAKGLPFYYYNMPSMTGVSLSVPKFLKEGKKVIPNLVGTKFTHNDFMEMAQCINLNDKEFEVLNGFDECLICGLALGAKAGVGSTYNYIPQIYQGIMDAMDQGNIEEARRLQMKSIEVVDIIVKYGGGIRGGKAIMKLIGCDCGNCRLPIAPFTDQEYMSLKEDLQKLDLLSL